MATVNFIPCKKQNAFSMRNEIEYILQDFKVCIEPEKFNCDHTVNYQTYSADADKTGCIRLISGKDCCPETAFQEFMATKNSFKKTDKTMFYHYDQAFKDGETISPKTAHEIAIKFAEDNYPDYEVVIATHVDNEHLHSHFIINSVSFKTGKKLHQGPKTLFKLRSYSDQICKQYGLTTLEPYTGGKSKSLASREYRAAAKGQSWKFSLMNAIDIAMKISGTKADFIKNMERQGYAVKWTDTRKYITYTCPNTMSCRDIKLHDNRYLKEMMEREPNLWRDTNPDFAFRTLWLMVDRESKRIVGQFSFNGRPSPDADVEIFFSVEKPFRKMGYATEVMIEVLKWGGQTKLFHRVLIDADEGNKAAMASLKKLGFRKCNTSINEVTSTYYKAVYDRETDVSDLEVEGNGLSQ